MRRKTRVFSVYSNIAALLSLLTPFLPTAVIRVISCVCLDFLIFVLLKCRYIVTEKFSDVYLCVILNTLFFSLFSVAVMTEDLAYIFPASGFLGGLLTVYFLVHCKERQKYYVLIASTEIENAEKTECSICLDIMEKNLIKLKCEHVFHKKCIGKWLNFGSRCPNCNAELLRQYGTFAT